MEELANLPEGSSLHEVKINQTFEGDSHIDIDIDIDLDEIGEECGFIDSRNRLRNSFDELFGAFSSERSGRTSLRSVPSLHGDGRKVDLFKLFWVVRKIGGYDTVCGKSLWGFVAEQCGLKIGDVAFLKLIYVKYLNEFDEWLWNLYGEGCLVSKEGKIDGKLDFFLQELETKFRRSLLSGREDFKSESKFSELENNKNSAPVDFRIGRCVLSGVDNVIGLHMNGKGNNKHVNTRLLSDIDKELNLSKKRVFKDVSSEKVDHAKQESTKEDFRIMAPCNKFTEGIISKHGAVDILDKCCLNSYDKMMISARNDVDRVLDSQKRKSESFSLARMLYWVKDASKHSDAVDIGDVPECTNWKNHATQEAWIQALLIREARFVRRYSNLNAEESGQQPKKRRTSSLMSINANVKGSRRLCKRCLATHLNDMNCKKTEPEIEKERNMENNIFIDEPESELSVGPQFQAEIPEWTSNISESDSKWLGTRVWPPEHEQTEPILELLPIGKGRENSCDCQCPNSVECFRFHIAEKRLKLKIELGSVFYEWMFNRMGEEVSLSWTEQEEDRFKGILTLHAESRNKFWNNARKIFPSKKRGDLVSYYFNVFLIQRRIYQNRVTPHDIDSDDDEKQFGSVGERFGYAALKLRRSSLIPCTENKQCIEFE